MKLIELEKFKIAIHPCFIIVALVMIALGLIEQFFVLFIVTTIHELSHIMVSKAYGAKLQKVIIYPIGEMAIIGDMLLIKSIKRMVIILAGPIVNIVLGFILLNFSHNEHIKFISTANFCIGLFNIMPIYPLDGGRLMHTLFSDIIGVLNSNDLILKISKVFIIIIIMLGIIQVVLYPYNISLICIGLYLQSNIKKEEFNLCLNFFEVIFLKGAFIDKNGGISTKMVTVSENVTINNVLKYLKSSSLCRIYIVDKQQKCLGDITESQLLNYVLDNGVQYSIKNVIKI